MKLTKMHVVGIPLVTAFIFYFIWDFMIGFIRGFKYGVVNIAGNDLVYTPIESVLTQRNLLTAAIFIATMLIILVKYSKQKIN